MNKRIFYVSGGGDETQSQEIDRDFARHIDGKKLMYIPVALNRDSLGFEACYDWITRLFLNFTYKVDVPEIHMYLDPAQIKKHISEYDALYIGGGNTYKLLDFLKKNNLFEDIRKFYEGGKPIYGGSAGAIILGNSIDTVAEENDAEYQFSDGYNLAQNKSFICHYDSSLDNIIESFTLKNNQEVIALPEDAGLCFESGSIVKVFGESKSFIGGNKIDLLGT